MLDGTRLRQSWYEALDNAQTSFRQHLTSHSSNDWKRVSIEGSQSSAKGKARALTGPHLTDVVLHRKVTKGESVYRVVLDVPTADEPQLTLEACKAVLATLELRKEWDPSVEQAQLLEMFDQATRISKTNFTLGWPASPRDAVTISRMFNDATTLIDISTSLPRSSDEPAYLRPSPPYVRSEVGLFAWCIQHTQNSSGTTRLRITCFWQHNLRALWNFGTTFSLGQQLCAMMVGFYKTVKTRGLRIPLLTGYGHGVSVERVRFQNDREALTVDYSIVQEDDEHAKQLHALLGEQGVEELHAIREHRRLTRSVEFALPPGEGWDIQVTTKASSDAVSQLPWTAHAVRDRSSSSANKQEDKVVLNVKHASLPNDHAVLKVRAVIELSGPSSGWRLNGIPQPIEEVEERDPYYFMSQPILQDTASMADLSFRSQSTRNTISTVASGSSTIPEPPQIAKVLTERSAAAERSILSRVKRNYIYFSSLLQEPEAKWKRTTESRGVSVAQLDSIDPTLVVYRAEATFVGLGLWDLYAAIATPGARAFWDKLHDDAVFLEDVNQLTELWHYKTKPAWPVNGRDAVVLKTVYKSPTTIHVFAFSADDPNLFPSIPPADPSVIRTQVDLQGWAIEALSPTTTLVSLLEQSDPKGWSNKASIPQQMISAIAGIGDFTIKCGGPPLITRLEGAKVNDMRYDHEKGSFRIEYEGAMGRTSSPNPDSNAEPQSSPTPMVECELRCDLDTWATSLDIVIDPPPQTIVCLRRHRLSSAGGGLWLTVTHDAIHTGDERLQVIVRRSPQGVAKEKGLVMVNGAKVDVDVEGLPEREAKNLAKQKRIKPIRIPLDQPPVLGVIRRRKAEWDGETDGYATETGSSSPTSTPIGQVSTSAPAFATAFTRYWNYAIEQATTTTQQAVAAVSPAIGAGIDAVPSSSKPPMQYALEALAYLQGLHSRPSNEGWVLLSDKGFPVHRKVEPYISSVIPVHKAEKVIESVSADEIVNILLSDESRKQWDTRFDSTQVFESFGSTASTTFTTHKAGFPFRDRGFYLANLMARAALPRRNETDPEHSGDNRTAIFLVSASFSPESVQNFSQAKYNPHTLPIGRMFVDGWILETLDPYSAENYAIPSTRCTRVVAVDYAGSIPAAVNSSVNAAIPRSIIALESYLANVSPPPFPRIPPAGVMISNRADVDINEKAWAIRKRDTSHTLVATRYDPTERILCGTLLLDVSTRSSASPTPNASDRTPRPSVLTTRSRATTYSEPASTQSEDTTPTSLPNIPHAARRSQSRDVRSSKFTVRGEVKHPTDLMVGELVVDTKLYPNGYTVSLRSRIDKSRQSLPLAVRSDGDEAAASETRALPISTAVFTMPPSPLLSSGLNTDRPPCHLLRLTLPTAQYQMSTIQDPLTGETRSAPPKPQWVLDLEDERAVVDVEIRPAPAEKQGELGAVVVDGAVVAVLSEKESLTSLGREELLDGRTAKMDLLVRTTSDEAVPQELQSAIAVAAHLLDKAPTPVAESPSSTVVTDALGADSLSASSPVADEKTQADAASTQEGAAHDGASSGLLRFLNSYPNPLTRFTTPAARPILRTLSGSTTVSATPTAPPPPPPTTSPSAATLSPRAATYPLSTVIVVGLIAFLIGSLLRSMLSPADFVYVVSELEEADDVSSGWREIRRLLELKYIVGGWDFQVALVRRQ